MSRAAWESRSPMSALSEPIWISLKRPDVSRRFRSSANCSVRKWLKPPPRVKPGPLISMSELTVGVRKTSAEARWAEKAAMIYGMKRSSGCRNERRTPTSAMPME